MSTIKECFTSRFDGGSLIQFDYSQLEVVCLAFLAQDVMLRADLLAGKDMHCMSGAFMLGKTYEEVKEAYDMGRKWAMEARHKGKPLGFLVQYGGAAGLMAKQTGLPKKDCTNFIKEYYNRYKGVKEWQNLVARDVEANAVVSDIMIGNDQAKKSVINSLTGRRYTFVEQRAPAWASRPTSFSPTQMKNFKIQGFATGDIVPMMLGKVNRFLYDEEVQDDVLIINTTHDSIMLDCAEDIEHETLIPAVINEMEKAPQYLEEIFDIDFDMPLKVTAELGPNWGALKPWVRDCPF